MWESWDINDLVTGRIGTATPDSSIVREMHAFGNSLLGFHWCIANDELMAFSVFIFQKTDSTHWSLIDEQKIKNGYWTEQEAQTFFLIKKTPKTLQRQRPENMFVLAYSVFRFICAAVSQVMVILIRQLKDLKDKETETFNASLLFKKIKIKLEL